jgi:two-component system OmpR family sensor kinase
MRDSLQFRLSAWLSVVILGVALVAGVAAFVSALGEAHELQDDVLRQVAALFDHHHLPMPSGGGRVNESSDIARVVVQRLSAGPSSATDHALVLPSSLPDGFQTIESEDESYRVLVKTLGSGERIAVAQETALRDEIARDSALRTLLPFLVLVPILVVVVADLVRKMFRPVAQASAEVDRRGDQDLQPIDDRAVPAEIRPFVVAINRLLRRISQSMEAQRRFVADAAHELRSPLTALALQAERLAGADMSDTARERLAALRRGVERSRALLDQLLALARAQASSATPATTVSARDVFRTVLEDLMPLAKAKGLDIGVTGDSDVRMVAGAADLITLVKNLVENAIRYTPAGGRVDLSTSATGMRAKLQIEDTGPGIPEQERERVFDPFYRMMGSDEAGSGLGLSIVHTIAERMGAQIVLGYADEEGRSGLRVTVTLPQGEVPRA